MNPSRTRILRISVPVAAALLALTACSSTSSDSSGADSTTAEATTSADEPMVDESADDASADMADEAMADESADVAAPMAGAFIDYADYEAGRSGYDAGTVVLFFNATWCSTCQETVENLTDDPDSIPAGLTIVSVDYDSADELRQQYGVTTQHTFVQVDADGTELAKWTGSSTAKAIAKKTI